MTWLLENNGTGSGKNVGRLYTAGKTYEAGAVLLDPATGLWFEQNEDGAFSYPSHEILSPDKYKLLSEKSQIEVYLGVDVSASEEIQLGITTSDGLDYEVDFGEGVGWEAATSWTTKSNTYAAAYSGTIGVRFSVDQYPTQLYFRAGTYDLTAAQIRALNRFNTISLLEFKGLCKITCDISELLFTGHKIDYFKIDETSSNKNVSGDLTAALRSGGVLPDYIWLSGPGHTMSFNMSEFMSNNSNTKSILVYNSPNMTFTVGSNITFGTEMTWIYLDMSLNVSDVDAVLEAAARDINSWNANKALWLAGTNAMPSSQGFVDKTTIEGQTGSPSVTVNGALLTHIPMYGQSLSLGAASDGGEDIITTAASGKDLMFNGGVRFHYDEPGLTNENTAAHPDQMASLVPLQEQINPNATHMQETFASGIGLRSTDKLLLTASGRGAYRAERLSRYALGSIPDQNHFANTYEAMKSGSILAAAGNYRYHLGPIVFKQGEADASNNTSRTAWKAEVKGILDDLIIHAKHAAHIDATGLNMLIDQLAFTTNGQGYEEIAVAAIELHRENSGVLCMGPTYPETFATSTAVHMPSNTYRNYGEKIGLIIEKLLNGETWNPCHITGVSRSGTALTVNVHVPVPPIAIDTTLVALVADNGFAYSGANITDVSVTDDGTGDNNGVITITLDADAAGTLHYAYDNSDINGRTGPLQGARGNIRDSHAAVTLNDGAPLYNWLCNDEWVVS